MNKILVLGIGNTVMGDDGIGVRVVEALGCDPAWADRIDLIDGGTASFELVSEVAARARVVIVDAADFKGASGDLRSWQDDDADRFLRSRRRTAHEVGLAEIVDMARLSGWQPKRWAIVGIQPAVVEAVEELSEPVAAAVSAACAEVRRLVDEWA